MTTHLASRGGRRRVAAWTLLPLLALTVLTGCNTDGSGDAGGGDESAAAEAESTEGGAGATGEVHDAESVLPAMQQALADSASARVQMEMTGAAEMTMDGQMQMSDDPGASRMAMTTDVQGQQIQMRLIGETLYLSGTSLTPQGKWVEADLSDRTDPAARQFGSVVDGFDLSTTFDGFEAGLRDVEHVGEEEIDGETVQHYVFTVDTAAAMKASGGRPQAGMPDQLTYDVWLTEDNLMRRVSFELGPVSAVINATEWGEPVEVEAPSKGDIIDIPGR